MLFSPTEQTSDAGFRSRFHRRSLEHQRPLSTVTMAFTVVAFITFVGARSLVAGPAVPLVWRLACALALALLVGAIPRTRRIWVFGGIGVAMARLAEDDQDKMLWLTLAQSWVRLAEHVERSAADPVLETQDD